MVGAVPASPYSRQSDSHKTYYGIFSMFPYGYIWLPSRLPPRLPLSWYQIAIMSVVGGFCGNELILEFTTKSMLSFVPGDSRSGWASAPDYWDGRDKPRALHSQTILRSRAVELHPHTIIPRLDIRRQLGAQFGVVEIAVHVGEDRAFRADAVDPSERQVEVKMTRMRPVPERVDDPQLDAGERLYGSLRHIHQVGRVGHGTEAESEGGDVAVGEQERHRRDGAARSRDRHRLARGDRVPREVWRIAAARRGHEAISEPQREDAPGRLVCIHVYPPLMGDEQRAQVVDAVDVVGMFVGVEHAVEMIDGRVKQLLAQVRRGVHQ